MPTVLTASEVFSRTIAFANLSRWAKRPPPDALVQHLSSSRVLITGDREVLQTQAGQHAAAFLVNLVSRFCPAVEIDVPGHLPLLISGNALLTGPTLQDALASVPRRIWGTAMPPRPARFVADLVISIGPRPITVPCLQLTYGNWWGAAAEKSCPGISRDVDRRAFGPLVAACLGANGLFKAVLMGFADRYSDLANENTRWDLRAADECLSLLNYSLGPEDFSWSVCDRVPWPVAFISAGAICSAVAYGLHTAGLMLPEAMVFEPKLIDPPDLNRYVTAIASDIDRSKVDVLISWLRTSHTVEARADRFSGAIEPKMLENPRAFLVGVDHVPSRWTAQSCWPDLLLVGATEHDQLRVSAHSAPLQEAACVRCLDTVDAPTLPGEIIPAVSFVSAFTGIIMAGELLKHADDTLVRYRLRNVVGGRLLQLGQPWNWRSAFRDRVPDCELCGGSDAA